MICPTSFVANYSPVVFDKRTICAISFVTLILGPAGVPGRAPTVGVVGRGVVDCG